MENNPRKSDKRWAWLMALALFVKAWMEIRVHHKVLRNQSLQR